MRLQLVYQNRRFIYRNKKDAATYRNIVLLNFTN